MDKCLLDTDILSEIFRARNATVRQHAAVYLATFPVFTLSAPTWMEVVSGYQRANRPDKLSQFIADYAAADVLPLDKDAAELAGNIHGELIRTGQTVQPMDCMIAAIALRHGLTLVTGNTRHYEHIAALGHPLKLENWRE